MGAKEGFMQRLLDIHQLRSRLSNDLDAEDLEIYRAITLLDDNSNKILEQDVTRPAIHEWRAERVLTLLRLTRCAYLRDLDDIAYDRLRGQVAKLLTYWNEDVKRYRSAAETAQSAYQRYIRYSIERTGSGIFRKLPMVLISIAALLLIRSEQRE